VFICYSHHDRRYLERLRVHVRPLERDSAIEIWDDTRISPGTDWQDAIADALYSAKAAILLVSADFIASDFIVNNELPPLLESASNGGTTVLCVILSPSRFLRMPELSRFQTVNSPNRPLSGLPHAEKEAVWLRAAEAVEAVFEGREATEGWLVRNERILFEVLRRLVREGEDGGFLIAHAGDYYVQFALEVKQQRSSLYCEAVKNAYLPPRLQLAEESIDKLISMGFEEPPDELSNYHRTYQISDNDEELREIANTAIRVLADVYEVSERVSIETTLDLGG
jgi:hypothetical protein